MHQVLCSQKILMKYCCSSISNVWFYILALSTEFSSQSSKVVLQDLLYAVLSFTLNSSEITLRSKMFMLNLDFVWIEVLDNLMEIRLVMYSHVYNSTSISINCISPHCWCFFFLMWIGMKRMSGQKLPSFWMGDL